MELNLNIGKYMDNLKDLQKRAQESLANQQGLVRSMIQGDEFTKDEIAQEMQKLQAQDQNIQTMTDKTKEEAQQKANSDLDSRIDKSSTTRSLGLAEKYDPKMLEYASTIFPSLKEMGLSSPTQIPFAPQEQQDSTEPEQPSSSIQKTNKQPETASIESPEIQQMQQQQQVQQEFKIQPSQEDEISSLMKQVNEREKAAKMDLAVAKFRDAIIGAGGTGYKSDLSQYEAGVTEAKKPLQDYQTRLQLMEVKEQLADKKAKNDSNSAISKMLRQSLQDIGVNMDGFDNVSYNQLEKIYPSLANAVSTKIAADAKKIEAVARREEAAQNKIDRLDQKQKENLIKHIDFSMRQLSKDFGEYEVGKSQLQSAADILDKVKKGEISPGMADVTSLYTVVKGLDPNSAVREGEIALSREAMSLWGKLYSGTKSISGGDLLDATTRKSIQEILKAIQTTREKSFGRKKDAIIKAGVGKGLDKQILEDSIYPDVKSAPPREEIRTKMINGEPVKFRKTSEGWKKV